MQKSNLEKEDEPLSTYLPILNARRLHIGLYRILALQILFSLPHRARSRMSPREV